MTYVLYVRMYACVLPTFTCMQVTLACQSKVEILIIAVNDMQQYKI